MEVITTYYTLQHCLTCVCNSTMLMTFPTVFMYTEQIVTIKYKTQVVCETAKIQ